MSIRNQNLAQHVGQAFAAAHHELFLVGGAVRDEMLGQPTAGMDLDFATSARPTETFSILSSLGWGQPYRVGEKFGTIALKLDGRTVEVTTYRSERYQSGSRKPEVEFGATLTADLERRDFTINAIAREPLTGEIIDPMHGMRDLTAGLIRAVGRASERFRDDPLRLLRAIRFATFLGFDIDGPTWTAMVENAGYLSHISRERIRDEYTRMLEGPRPSDALTLIRDSGLMANSVPLLHELTRMPDHGPRHPLSLWDHTMRVVDAVSPLLALRWAALLHDIAKPRTRTTEPSGRPRFFHHEEVGAEIARQVLSGLRYSNQTVDAVTLLVETHMQLHSYDASWTDGAVRRLILRLGPMMEPAIDLARADAAGHTIDGISANAPKFDHLESRIRALDRHHVESMKSPLTGEDLMQRYQRPPGPWIGRIKDTLQNEVLEGRLRPEDRDTAWEMADKLAGVEA